ncbi:MAG TPA: homocysteine S-methyltransferase family protein [Acidimicrobiia bacterium]
MAGTGNGLHDRLGRGAIICGEGYLFELERRGYVQAGPFVPEVVLEHPEVVEQLHRELVRAGSDVVEAFTYYAHREKLRVIGREDSIEEMNRQALAIAGDVARGTGTLFAGNICNTNVYEASDTSTHASVRRMFEEQVTWALDAGVDYIIAETLDWYAEAALAREVIAAAGLPAVVTLAPQRDRYLFDGVDIVEACERLSSQGADVVGLNCQRGPATMMPLIHEIRQRVETPVAALPVPYRTTKSEPTFTSLTDTNATAPDDRTFPTALDPFTATRYECAAFALECRSIGVEYIGLCCGAGPHHLRAVAEALGRNPEASRYAPDMSRHAFYGDDPSISEAYRRRGKDF